MIGNISNMILKNYKLYMKLVIKKIFIEYLVFINTPKSY